MRIVLLTVLSCLALVSTVAAQPINESSFLNSGTDFFANMPNGKPTAGFYLQVRVPSRIAPGTIRVEIDFSTVGGGPTTAQRDLVMRLLPTPGAHCPPTSATAISLPITIPQGTTTLRIARHVPKTSFGNSYQIIVQEDGDDLAGFRSTVGRMNIDGWNIPSALPFTESKWNWLWVNDPADEDTREASFQQRMVQSAESVTASYSNTNNNASVYDLSQMQNEIEQCTVDRLPRDWRGYGNHDCVIVSHRQWSNWQTDPTPQMLALRSWVVAGGFVIVRGSPATDGNSIAGKVDKMLLSQVRNMVQSKFNIAVYEARSMQAALDGKILPEEAQAMKTQFENAAQMGGMSMDASMMGSSPIPIEDPDMRAMMSNGVTALKSLAADAESSLGRWSVDELAAAIRIEPMAAGEVLYFSSKDGSDDEPIPAALWLFVDGHRAWKSSDMLRKGVDPALGSSRFFQWTIPGVAQPPVYAFMGLLGVFVVLVGPVAYRKTMRSGRGYLMFAIAPVLAFVTTAAMLTYGVVSDGFGTQTRIRQITWVDPKTSMAVTRTRATYFAGIRPNAGLKFHPNADVTVYPDNEYRDWEERLSDRFSYRGLATVTEDEIRLDGSFLPSRQQKQFVTHRPHNDWGSLSIDPAPVTPPPPLPSEPVDPSKPIVQKYETPLPPRTLTNSMKIDLQEVIVRDANGNFYAVDRVAANGTAEAKWIATREASERYGELYKREWLVSELVQQRTNNANNYNNSSYSQVFDLLLTIQNQLPGTMKPLEGIIETELQQRLQLGAGLPNNSFIAIADLSDDALAIESAVATASIHYVMGDLQ